MEDDEGRWTTKRRTDRGGQVDIHDDEEEDR
jgi:hypothetical protein